MEFNLFRNRGDWIVYVCIYIGELFIVFFML